MSIQRTVIRYTRVTKTYDDRCAEIREKLEIFKDSNLHERKATPPKLATKARKEKKTTRRKNGKMKSRRKPQAPKFKQTLRNFGKWCQRHQEMLLSMISFAIRLFRD